MPKKSAQIYRPAPAAPKQPTHRANVRQQPQTNRVNIAKKLELARVDFPALLLILMLLVIGLIALFSASYPIGLYRYKDALRFIKSQAAFAVIGVAAMLFVSLIDYKIYGKFQKVIAFVAFVMLALVLVPGVGITHNNATRWINLPIIGEFQPSELVKTSIIISFSYYAVKMDSKIRTYRGIIPFFIAMGIIAFMLSKQPHMSAIIITCGIGLCILFVAGIKIWYFFPIGAAGIGAFMYAYNLPQFAHVRERIEVWLDPFIDLTDTGYQAANSFVAIGSGGFWGLGLGQGRQKQLYLPEPQNDFVFAVWCEEMGFVGAVFVMVLFALLIYRGYVIAKNSKDKFGCLLAVGITSKLAIQTLMNLFVVSGLMPVTGASLPFFSYGGTALLFQLGEMGILLSVSRKMRRKN